MKTKVLFTAALMAAAASGAQAASYTESNMLLQLLESQRYEGVSLLADEVAEVRDIATLAYTGATLESGQEYYLYNVGAGKFLEGGNSWGTQASFGEVGASIVITSTGENVYSLSSPYNNGGENHYLGTDGYLDNTPASSTWTLTAVGDGTNAYTLSVPNGACCGYDGSSTVMSLSADAASDNAKWLLVSKEERANLMKQATAESGVDASFFIVNPNFSRNYNPWGWAEDGSKCTHTGDDTDKLVEIYNQEGVNFYQTINGLPNGKYVVSCVGFYRNGNVALAAESRANGTEVINSYLYAGGNQTPLVSIFEGWGKTLAGTADATIGEETKKIPNWPREGATDFRGGVYPRTEVEATVTDGTLTFGIRKTALTDSDWTLFDSFRLTYYGAVGMEDMAAALTAKVKEAHALAKELGGLVPTTYIEQLNAVEDETYDTEEEYSSAIAAINEVITAANAAKTEMANVFFTATDYAEQVLVAFPGADESAKSTLNSAIEAATTAALASTDATVWATQAEAVRAATKTYFDATDKVMAEGVSNFDVTQLFVVNPGFQDAENPANGWNGLDASNVTESGIAHRGGNDAWRISQTVNVPNGVYSMSLQIGGSRSDRHNFFLRSSNGDQTVMFKWNVDANAVLATWPTDEEAQRNYTGNVLVTDGQITMGVERRYDPDEIYFDNFRLTLVSDGFADIKALYDALKLQAEGIETEGMPTVFAKALTDALALPVGTAAQYYTAYNALQKAVADCGTVADASVSLPALITECQAYLDNSEGGDEARAALEDALEAAEGYLNLTTAEEIMACEAALETARQEFAKVATPTGEQQFDMTFLLTNACSMGETTGWYGDVVGGNNIGISRSASYIGDLGYSCFVEKWSASVLQPTEDGNGWLIYQQAVLPAGAYTLTAAAFTDMPYNADETVTGHASANLSAGFGSTTIAEGDPIVWTEHEKYPGEVPAEENQNKLKALSIPYFYVAEATTVENPLKLGIYIKADNGADWFGINDMKLYKVAPVAEELALDETQAYAVTADMYYANVTMQRTLKAGYWNTFCVPFDMTPEQLTANGISEVRTFSQAAAQGTSVTLQTTVVSDGVKAGIPYIVKVDGEENVTEISVDGVSVTAAEPASHEIAYSDAGYVEWRGNYSAGTVPMGAYFISDDMFYVADTEVALNGFRAYVMLVDEAGAPVQSNVNRMLIDIDGEVTGIEDVLGDGASDANKLVNVYTIGGVLVKSQVKKGEALDGLQKGAYIVDGKTYLK